LKMESTRLELDKPLILPDKLRAELRKIYGEIRGENELPDFLKGKLFYTVGDVVTYTVLKLGLEPKIAIVDYRTMRREVNFEMINFDKGFSSSFEKPDTDTYVSTEQCLQKLKWKQIRCHAFLLI